MFSRDRYVTEELWDDLTSSWPEKAPKDSSLGAASQLLQSIKRMSQEQEVGPGRDSRHNTCVSNNGMGWFLNHGDKTGGL